MATRVTFAQHVEGTELKHDLDALMKEAIPFVAAVAVQDEPDHGFWLEQVLDQVVSVRNQREFARAMYGRADALFLELANKYLLDRVRYHIKVRDPKTNVRVYVSWRVPRMRPHRWGALHWLSPDVLRLVARDYGILGEGIAYSRDATLYLVDLMEQRHVTAVKDVWAEAAVQLEQWKKAG